MQKVGSLVILLFGLLVAGTLFLSACGGTDCGEGTVEEDGECVLEGDTGCPAGTVEEDGECVPVENGGELECGSGTFEVDGECVPEQEIDCDAGEVFKDGQCVDEVECGPNTQLDENNMCIADEAVECGDNTELDPNENECIPTDEVCGDNTAFSGDEGTCVPTETVCAEGTYYNGEEGLCYPEAQCQPGDAVLDGYCVSEAEEMAANADVVAGDDTNLLFDGVPADLPVGGDGDPTIFTGTIDAPDDLDGDGELNQQMNVFEIEAEAGDWIEISVRSMGHFDPAFQLLGADLTEDSYNRLSSFGTGSMKVRQFLIPESRSYYLLVQPELGFLQEAPVGAADWDYVGTVEELERPTAMNHEFEDEDFDGEFGALDENFLMTDEFSAETTIAIDLDGFSVDVDPILQLWSSEDDYIGEFFPTYDDFSGELIEFSIDEIVADSGELYVVVDWFISFGSATLDYTLSIEETVEVEDGEEVIEPFTANEDDGIRVTVDFVGDGPMDVAIIDDADDSVVDEGSLGAGGELIYLGLDGGDYSAVFENNSGEEITNFQLEVDVTAAIDIGGIEADSLDVILLGQVNDQESEIYLSAVHDDSGDVAYQALMPHNTFIGFYAEQSGDHTAYHYNFDGITGLQFFEELREPVELDTFTVPDSPQTEPRIYEVSHDHPEPLYLAVVQANETEILIEGEVSDEDDGLALIAPLDADYTVSYYDLEGEGNVPDASEVEISTDSFEPEPITDFSETIEGTSDELIGNRHDYYLVNLSDTTTYDVSLEKTGGEGRARFAFYTLAHDQLAMSEEAIDEDDVVSEEFEFVAGVNIIVRVGNYYGDVFFDPLFDYELSFEEL